MISFDFAYYKPTSISEAVQVFYDLQGQGKNPIYYAGGTEIINMARQKQLFMNAVIDLKAIPECNVLEWKDDKLVIGSCMTLTQIEEINFFPLISEVSKKIADHTSRNKITLGGNIAGKIIYREALLPLLLSDSEFVIASKDGIKTVPIQHVFKENLQLDKGEFLVQILTDRHYTTKPYAAIRRTKQGSIDYPLVTVAALKTDNQIRFAFSGVCSFPFRSIQIENELNHAQMATDQKIGRVLNYLPAPILDDLQGSKEFRSFVLRNTLTKVLEQLGGA